MKTAPVVSFGANICPRKDTVIICRGAATTGCDSIINLTVFNAKQTYAITPANPVLNCNPITLRVNLPSSSDSCAQVAHGETYSWFSQATAADPLSSTGSGQSNLTINAAGIYTVVIRDSVFFRLRDWNSSI